MRIDFRDPAVRRLYEETDFVLPELGPDLVRAFRKKVGFIVGAESEQDLRTYKALHFEKLKGGHAGQYSIRLNQQWRLILLLESDSHGRIVIIVEIIDYH